MTTTLFPWEPPSWIDAKAWGAFVKMRKAKGSRAPFTEEARDRAVIVLDRLRSQGHPPAEVLWQSVLNGWSGLFGIKETEGAPTTAGQQAVVQTQNLFTEWDRQREAARSPESVAARQAALAKMGRLQ